MAIELRDEVDKFSQAMEDKLRTLDEERGEAGWLNGSTTIAYLLAALEAEVRELRAGFSDCDQENVLEESVDVANFAMMIYSRVKQVQGE